MTWDFDKLIITQLLLYSINNGIKLWIIDNQNI